MTQPHDHRVLAGITAARHEEDLTSIMALLLDGLTEEEAMAELVCAVGGLVGLVTALEELIPEGSQAIDHMNQASAIERHIQ